MKIKLSRGATINMGNYQSYRFDVGMEEDFGKDVSFEDAYFSVYQDVNQLFDKEMKEAKKQAK